MTSLRILKATIIIALVCAFLIPVWGEAKSYGPFIGLTQMEVGILDRGEPVIRSVHDARRLSLASFDEKMVELHAYLTKLNPNYITELLLSFPVKDTTQNEHILNRLTSLLADVSGYVNIPYWSVRQQTTYALFDKMEILTRTPIEGGESIVARQHMEPFDIFEVRYEYRRYSKDTLIFSGINLEPIVYSYNGFKAVASGGMLWELYAFVNDGRLYVYGVGGVKVFDLFGLFRERLEPSFMGRVAAFFKYISKNIDQ